MKKQYILVLDAGTGAGRCNIFDLNGNLAGSAYKEWYYILPVKDNSDIREFDPEEFWNILCEIIKEAMLSSGIKPEEIICVTSTSQREGIVLLNKDDREIYAGPNLDFRGNKEAEMLVKNFGEEIYNISGHWPHDIFAPSRLLWFKNNNYELYKNIGTMLMINDWMLFKLTGEKYSEPSNASETLLFNIHTMDWDRGLIEKIGLNPDIFPRVKQSGEVIGEVTRLASELTGLKEGTLVTLGGADTQCALLGTGGLKEGHVAIVSGTSTPVQVVTDKPIIDERFRVWSGCHVVLNKWVIDSNARPTGVIYRWLRDTLYLNDNRNMNPYEIMNIEAESASPGSNGVMAFLGPSISNVSEKYSLPETIIGLKPGYEKELCNRGVFSRSILENIAYAVKGNFDQIQELVPDKIDRVYMTGGSTKSKLLTQIIAAVIGLPVILTDNSESTSLGAAICGAVGLKAYNDFDEAIKNMVRYKDIIEPDKKNAAVYKELYERWLKTYYFLIENSNSLI